LPFLWKIKNEWLVIIVDNARNEVSIVYAKYSNPSLSHSTQNERAALNFVIKERITRILTAMSAVPVPVIAVVPTTEGTIEQRIASLRHPPLLTIDTCKFIHYYHDEELVPSDCHRTPPDRSLAVLLPTDSGLYVVYAIECDYFDVPVYMGTTSDVSNFRQRLAFWILSKQLMY
jgi:hypothetical protein